MNEDFANTTMVTFLGAVLLEHLLDIADIVLIPTDQTALVIIAFVVRRNASKLVRHLVMVLGAAADLDARDGTQHDRQANEGDVDKDVGNALLIAEVEEIFVVRCGEASQAHNVTNQQSDNRGRS